MAAALCFVFAKSSAYDFKSGGINYNIIDANSVEVTNPDAYDYSGNIVIPSTVTHEGVSYSVARIRTHAFQNCKELIGVSIPNSVTSIGGGAFIGSDKLVSVNIPNSVTTIKESTFHGCSSLKSIKIPNSVTSIEYNAFFYCIALESISIPSSVTEIDQGAFSSCTGLKNVRFEDGEKPLNFQSRVFAKDNLQECYIGRVLTGSGIFVDASFSNIIIGDGVKTIGSGLYSGSDITSITIPETVTCIGDGAFLSCNKLTSVTIHNSVASIGKQAFYRCKSLKDISIPSSVDSIGEYAFYECTGLAKVRIENGEKALALGASVFSSATNLQELYLGRTLTGKKPRFEPSLDKVTISDFVTSIGNELFYDCSALDGVSIPSTVTSIGDRAFQGCSGLSSLTIPCSVTHIGEFAFYGCTSLVSMSVPDLVEVIGDYTFRECSSLKEMSLGAGLREIKRMAFWDCTSLSKITCASTTPPSAHSLSFDSKTYDMADVYVPQESLDDYKNANTWKRFKLHGADITGIDGVVADGGKDVQIEIFDMQGRKLPKPVRGLNIIDGKKVMVK